MIMPRSLRKFVLTTHIVTSVGWLGAVAGFLVVAIAGVTSSEIETTRGAYIAMELMGKLMLVPLSLASLISGTIQSLGTRWGLFRHYWVIAKLVINILATGLLIMYTQTLETLGQLAAQPTLSGAELALLRTPSPMLHSGAALLALVLATVLSVYKPYGLTGYGWSKQQEERTAAKSGMRASQ